MGRLGGAAVSGKGIVCDGGVRVVCVVVDVVVGVVAVVVGVVAVAVARTICERGHHHGTCVYVQGTEPGRIQREGEGFVNGMHRRKRRDER